MSDPFAPGAVHAGWKVAGPRVLEGGLSRYPVERGDEKGSLSFFSGQGRWRAAHEAAGQRLERAGRVSHPALVAIDRGRAGSGTFSVLPALERLPRGPLPEPRALALLERLAEALAALHAGGVVHGELDAWSVVLRGDEAALLPPGLRPPPAGLEDLGLEVDPRYAAPEVLDGRPATPASDVFSLGLVLFRMVSGQTPAPAADPNDALAVRGALAVPDLAQARPDVARPVLALYQLLCAGEGLRPGDGAAALDAIRRAARGKAVPVPERRARRIEPDRVGGALVLLLVGLLSAAGAFFYMESHPPLPPTEGFELTVPAAPAPPGG